MLLVDINSLKEMGETLAWCVPIVNGLVEVFSKKAFNLPQRFIPASAIVFGVATGLVMIGLNIVGAVAGVLIGLAATGLWEFGSRTIGGKQTEAIKPVQ